MRALHVHVPCVSCVSHVSVGQVAVSNTVYYDGLSVFGEGEKDEHDIHVTISPSPLLSQLLAMIGGLI